LGENEFKRVSKAVSDDDDDGDNGSAMLTLDLVGLTSVQRALDKMDQIFGIFYNVPAINGISNESNDESNLLVPDDVMQLVAQRTAAKDSKDWALADSIRSKITALGFDVKDIKGGDPIITRSEASLVNK
jgi:cysteinyl-tRNA synthetase